MVHGTIPAMLSATNRTVCPPEPARHGVQAVPSHLLQTGPSVLQNPHGLVRANGIARARCSAGSNRGTVQLVRVRTEGLSSLGWTGMPALRALRVWADGRSYLGRSRLPALHAMQVLVDGRSGLGRSGLPAHSPVLGQCHPPNRTVCLNPHITMRGQYHQPRTELSIRLNPLDMDRGQYRPPRTDRPST